jgi:hypothetical protein
MDGHAQEYEVGYFIQTFLPALYMHISSPPHKLQTPSISDLFRLTSIRSKYSPQHPVPQHPQSIHFPYCMQQVSHPHTTDSKIIVSYTLIFTFLDKRWEDRRF